VDDRLSHDHHQLTIVTRDNVLETFGSTVARYIPDYPEYIRATVRGRGASLSRLPCQCIGKHNAGNVMTTERKDFENTVTETTQTLSEYKKQLRGLLAAARAGEDVDPREVAAAREGVELEKLRAEGEAERLAEGDARAEREALKALSGPINEGLTTSQARLQRKYTTALRALEDLLETVDRHNALVADSAGKTRTEVVTERYTSHATIDGTRHDFWRPQIYLLNMLHSIGKRWPVGRGTPFRMELPPAVQGGPRP
jgi:hypothetical protein